jgi:hypothetical protein
MQGIRGGRLDPKLDIVFWMLFGAEQNRALLISLLNAGSARQKRRAYVSGLG